MGGARRCKAMSVGLRPRWEGRVGSLRKREVRSEGRREIACGFGSCVAEAAGCFNEGDCFCLIDLDKWRICSVSGWW
jgi:hypothetical protein